jgi:ubiquinone/menaquinone biosynthesis C-methylase UbiE
MHFDTNCYKGNTMTVKEILTNYNKLGTAIIETIYTDNYLSIGGTESTETLAELAGITPDSRVLDVGSGVGGPSLHLAATYGCHITGLDLVGTNVGEANDRAKARGLDHLATFETGDALDMPFEDNSFNVVWGQDAWCHMPDKEKLIDEVLRVLAPGGDVAFTDWTESNAIKGNERSDLLSAMAAPNIAKIDDYQRYLEARGCNVLVADDISALFTAQYRDIMSALAIMERTLTEKFSPKIYQIIAERNGCILNGFESGALGGSRIVARKS